MIIFLYGEDSFRSKQKLDDIINGYKKANPALLSLIFFDAQNNQFDEFYSQFGTSSLFSKKKLLVVNNSFTNKEFQEAFLEKIEELENAKDIIVVYESAKADERTKFFKQLLKVAKSQKFDFLNPVQIRKWIAGEFQKNGSAIAVDAIDLLAEYVKHDTWSLFQEIQKLCNYTNKKSITKEDVKLQVKPNIENFIFDTINALAGQNKKQAMMLLQNHLESGDSPLYLLSMIAYQFRNFLVIKDLVDKKTPYYLVAKHAGLHPFVVQKSIGMVNRFSMEKLKDIYMKIFEIDEEMKTGKIEPEMALDMLLAEI